MLDLDQKQKEEDQKIAIFLGHEFRVKGIWGYIQGLTIDNTLIRLVLFDDPMITLFHTIATRDIIYLDATGNIVENVKLFKRIYYYSLTLRHPFGLAPPIPVAEYITSSHTVESLRVFFMTLREKESVVFPGSQMKPKLLVTDLSIPLYASALLEFNKETIKKYLNRTFRIVNGTAEKSDFDSLQRTFSKFSKTEIEKALSR